jgi:hypothetical protein
LIAQRDRAYRGFVSTRPLACRIVDVMDGVQTTIAAIAIPESV